MFDALAYDFVRNACAAAVLASIACGIIGTLVVVNRIVFLAGGVAHAAYGGIGIAVHWGLPMLPCTVGFSLAASLGMAHIAYRHAEKADAAIGLLWAAGMAFGIILLDLTPGYRADLMSFLFGSILAVPEGDLLLMLVVDVGLLFIVGLCHQTLLVASFDPEFAEARGLPVKATFLLVVGMTALGVVLLIRIVGLVLVMALLTIPPFIAQRRARSLPRMMLAATLWSLVFCLSGLWLAYRFDLTSGAAIIAAAVVGFSLMMGRDMLLERFGKETP